MDIICPVLSGYPISITWISDFCVYSDLFELSISYFLTVIYFLNVISLQSKSLISKKKLLKSFETSQNKNYRLIISWISKRLIFSFSVNSFTPYPPDIISYPFSTIVLFPINPLFLFSLCHLKQFTINPLKKLLV
jgi:hypothetical protein